MKTSNIFLKYKTYTRNMRILNRVENYLLDNEYKIIIKNNQLNVVNYDEIIDFSLVKITIRIKQKIIIIEGNNLIISKMIDDEVLVSGNISNISIK